MSTVRALDEAAVARSTVLFCVLAALCEGIDLQAAGVAAAGIMAEFKPSPTQLGNFFSASTLGLLIGALLGGRLADRIGRKRVLVLSIALFGVFSLLNAFAFDLRSLDATRLLTGLGLGGGLPNLIALAAESSPPHRRSVNVALAYAGAPLGGAIASWISMVSGTSHWRSIFIAGGIAPLLLAPVMAAWLPESLAFQRARQERVDRGRVIEILTGGRAVGTLLLWGSFFFGLLMLYLLLNWLPTLLVGAGLTRSQAAGAQIGFNIGGTLAALLMGYLLEGRWRDVSLSATFIALPLLVLLLAASDSQLAAVTSLALLLGCAVIAAQAFLYAAAPSQYPTAIRGIGVGAAVAVGRLGSVVGPLLGGWLKSMGHSSSRLFLDLIPIVVLGSVCALWLARRMGSRREIA